MYICSPCDGSNFDLLGYSSFDKPEDASGYADSVREAMRDMRTLHKQATSVSAQDVEKGATGKVDGA